MAGTHYSYVKSYGSKKSLIYTYSYVKSLRDAKYAEMSRTLRRNTKNSSGVLRGIAARGLEEHMWVSLIFAIIVSFMLFTVFTLVYLAGNVGKCFCRLHPSNDRHFCLSLTCQKCRPDTSATFCYVGHFFGCRRCVGDFHSQHTFLHARRNQ